MDVDVVDHAELGDGPFDLGVVDTGQGGLNLVDGERGHVIDATGSRGTSRTMIDLLVGQWLSSAVESSGTSGFVSG
jgi:hypothetical protein